MIRAQQAMIELCFHCLMFAENVRYEFRRDYYEIISQIFNRDELQLTNVALCPEAMDERISVQIDNSSHMSIKSKKPQKALNNGQILPASPKENAEEDFEDLQFERVKQEKIKISLFY